MMSLYYFPREIPMVFRQLYDFTEISQQQTISDGRIKIPEEALAEIMRIEKVNALDELQLYALKHTENNITIVDLLPECFCKYLTKHCVSAPFSNIQKCYRKIQLPFFYNIREIKVDKEGSFPSDVFPDNTELMFVARESYLEIIKLEDFVKYLSQVPDSIEKRILPDISELEADFLR